MALLTALVLALVLAYVTQPLLWQPRVVVADAALRADPDRLARHVRTLSESLRPRDAAHPDGLDAVAAYIRAEFTRNGARVSDQPYVLRGRTYRNVIASYGPEDGARVIVGAHYDTEEDFPGADDDASGVAGLLELSRLLATAKPAGRVDLVAFTLEEPPYFATSFMGSAVHAAALRQGGASVRLMISLEMIGYFSDAEGSQTFPVAGMAFLYPRTGNFIAVAGSMGEGLLVRRIKRTMLAASDLPVHSLNVPSTSLGVNLSDQRNFWAAGYRAVMISDTAFFRNTAYHSASDTAGRLDYGRMAKVVDGVVAVVQREAQPPQ